LFSTHNPNYWGKKTATGNVHTNTRGVVLTEHSAVLPGDVEITYYNHPNEESILDALRYAEFTVIESLEPQIVPLTNSVTAEEQELYRKLESKNTDSPLFFVVLARAN
jgi:hypothetical protein